MNFIQKEIYLSPKSRGFHIITGEIAQRLPEISRFSLGLAHIFICHTSASLTINENASPDVRKDLESHFNEMVPEMHPTTGILLKERMTCLVILNLQFSEVASPSR
jgi:secondary thiamine-phosphate synthase enzyme